MKNKKLIYSQRQILKSKWGNFNTKNTDKALKIPAPPAMKNYDKNGKIIDLIAKEKWRIKPMLLLEALGQRQSRRKYTEKYLTLEELSFLLFSTQGVRKSIQNRHFRTVPSAGCRHSFETYVYIDRVKNIAKGLYRYLPLENKLYLQEPYRSQMEKELATASMGQYWKAAVYLIWTTIPYRMEWSYADMAAKFIAIDVGHVCQNLYLSCEAIGCGTCGIGAYNQSLIDKFIGVDGKNEFSIYMAPVGKL